MEKYLFRQVTYLDGQDLLVKQGDVLLENGIIKKLGKVSDDEAKGAVLFAQGAENVLVPGYVNTHTHVAMTLLRDYGGDQALDTWLNQYIWPAEARLTDEDVYWGTSLGLLEMIASGTTCLVDLYDHCDAIAEAIELGGMRSVLCRGSVGMFDDTKRGIKENDALYDRWHNSCNGKIHVWYGPHAPNTCPGEYIQEMVNHARERGTGVHIHVAETQLECDYTREHYGMTPTGWLESLGVLDVPTLAAHSIWLTDEDLAIYAKRDVSVAHNPISNLKLASGIAPIERMRAMGMRVGLGTDGASSNNIMSMHREMQVTALLHKVRHFDPVAIGARDALSIATLGGAKAVHWENEIGSLEEGKQADMSLYKLTNPWNVPHHDVLSNLAYSAQMSEIDSVFVQGKCLYKHQEYTTLDKEKIMAQAEVRAKRLIQG